MRFMIALAIGFSAVAGYSQEETAATPEAAPVEVTTNTTEETGSNEAVAVGTDSFKGCGCSDTKPKI